MARKIHGNLEIKGGNVLIEGTENIHSDVITSLASFGVKGSATWFNYDGNVVNIIHNASTGTSAASRILIGDLTVPANETYGSLIYFGQNWDNSGTNLQNFLTLKSGNGSAGLNLDAESGTMSFMMKNGSDAKMVFTQAGYLGINSLIPGEVLEVGGNIKLSEGSNRLIYVGTETGTTGRSLTISSGDASGLNGAAGDLIIAGGSSTFGGSAVGGAVFISGGANGGSSNETVYIGGDRSSNETQYTLSILRNDRVGINTNNPSTNLHVFKTTGTTPSLGSDVVAVVQNNISTTTDSSMTIISGTSGVASLYFGDDDSATSGRILYDNFDDRLYFGTDGAAGPYVNKYRALVTRGQSVATRYDNITGTTNINLSVDAHFIVINGNASRAATVTYIMPDSSDGIEDGHVIELRVLGLVLTTVTLQASSGTPNGFYLLNATTPVTYNITTQHTSYRFIYESTLNRWVEL